MFTPDEKEKELDIIDKDNDVIEQSGERYIDIGGGNYAIIIDSNNVDQYKETLH